MVYTRLMRRHRKEVPDRVFEHLRREPIVRLTPEVIARLCRGSDPGRGAGRAIDALSAERDAKIVAALKAMRSAVAEGRKEPRLKTAR